MKYLFAILLCTLFFQIGLSQSATGVWKTIDDEEGVEKSHVVIVEKDGKLFGTILKLINPDKTTCTACKGAKKDMPIEGMEILWGLQKDSSTKWSGGKILDPKNGKEYKCKIELIDSNSLNVRGFIGFSLLGRTQTWYRVSE